MGPGGLVKVTVCEREDGEDGMLHVVQCWSGSWPVQGHYCFAPPELYQLFSAMTLLSSRFFINAQGSSSVILTSDRTTTARQEVSHPGKQLSS